MSINLEKPLSKETLDYLRRSSGTAYSEKDALKRRYPEAIDIIPIEDEKTDGQAVVLVFQTYTIVAFRGTESMKDWCTNIKIWPKSTPFGLAHFGFTHSFLKLWPQIKGYLDPEKKIILTGHSLGGALAQLCSLWICEELKIKPQFVVTFGQPRVGFLRGISEKTGKYMANHFFRITRTFDIVPRVPAYWMFYLHPEFTGFKRNKDGDGVPKNFIDKHWANIGWIFSGGIGYLFYISHSINTY